MTSNAPIDPSPIPAMSRRAPKHPESAVRSEIGQSRPFRSRTQEATIALLRTASVVGRVLARTVEPAGLSLAQYNALRIIGGAGTEGIPTLAVRDRMIEEGTPITRLIDKLEAAGLVHRERSVPDRRQVMCYATAEGRKLLARLDPVVDAADETVMAELGRKRIRNLVESLDRIRGASAGRGSARGLASPAGG